MQRKQQEQATEQPQQQQKQTAKKPKIGAGSLKAFVVQGVGELGQLTQAFPGDIKPVEVPNTIWGQNATPRDAYEQKHGVAEKAKAAEKQKQIEPGD